MHSFRVYPGSGQFGGKRKGFYFEVTIMKDQPDLMTYAAYQGSGKLGSTTQALCMGFRTILLKEDGSRSMKHCIGEIIFHLNGLNARYVSHECGHAALRWIQESKRVKDFTKDLSVESSGPVSDSEEDFCYALGDSVAQIYSELWSKNLIQ